MTPHELSRLLFELNIIFGGSTDLDTKNCRHLTLNYPKSVKITFEASHFLGLFAGKKHSVSDIPFIAYVRALVLGHWYGFLFA